jgi:hypothetical protein
MKKLTRVRRNLEDNIYPGSQLRDNHSRKCTGEHHVPVGDGIYPKAPFNLSVEYVVKPQRVTGPNRDRYLCEKGDGHQSTFPHPFRRVAASNTWSNVMSTAKGYKV